MQRFYTYLVIGLALVFIACDDGIIRPEETLVEIEFISQPQGGSDLTSIQAVFEAELDYDEGGFRPGDDTPDSVTIRCEWWWHDASGSNLTFVKADSFMISDEDDYEFTTRVTTTAGHVLIDYFWVEISWEDDDGTHQLNSDKALCVHS